MPLPTRLRRRHKLPALAILALSASVPAAAEVVTLGIQREPTPGTSVCVLGNLRLWIDTGTDGTNAAFVPADGAYASAIAVRDRLVELGMPLGPDFQHHVYPGAQHSEPSWAARFPEMLAFLFPVSQEPEADPASSPAGWVVSETP